MTASALVIGLGSIGKRHARLLGALGLDVAAVSRRGDPTLRCHGSLAQALARETPGYVVIANETSAHRPTLAALAASGFAGTVLVEKPLFAEPAPLPENRFAGLYVGYNLRFHPLLAELRRLLAEEQVVAAQVYAGQYLPDWRPGRDYRQTSSATRGAGGGVLRDLSHELDYMSWLFGPCRQVAALTSRSGALDIDAEDTAALLLAFERGPVATLNLNYLDRPGAREIVIGTARHTFRADLVKGSLCIDGVERLFPTERDDTYLAQHRSALGNQRETLCTAEEGAAVLALVAAAEEAAARGQWVRP